MTVRGSASATMARSWVLTSSVSAREAEDLDELAPTTRVESRGRLVEDQHRRVHRQHGGDRDALALTQRQVMGHPGAHAGHADGLEGTLDAMVDLSLWHAHVDRAEGDVLAHGRAEELVVGILEDQPDRCSDAA